jgi:hypothetical protein
MYAQVAANQQDWALADRLAAATAVSGNKALPHLLRARLLRSKGDHSLIEAELRHAVEKDETLLSKRSLAELLLSQRLNKSKSKEAFEILREISNLQDASGAEALTTALIKGIVPPSEIPSWVAAIRAHTNTNQRTLCLADYTEVLYGLSPQDKVVAKLCARAEKAPLQDRAEVMEWLVRLGQPALAAALLSPSEALESESSYYVWLDANSATENWPNILKSLDDPTNPIKEDFLINLYRAIAYFAGGRKKEAEILFHSVYDQTRGQNEKFLKCLAFLSAAKQDELFERGFRELLSDPINANSSFKAILPSIILRRDSAMTLRFYEVAVHSSTQLSADIAIQNDMIYLRILTGQDQIVNAEFLSQSNPMDQSLRITYAFAVLKGGDPAKALKILEASEQGIAASSLFAHEKAVVAIILAANDRTKEAELVTRMVQPNQLSIQEIQLVQSQFQKLNAKESASSSTSQSSPTSAMNGSPKATKKPKQ